MEANIADSADKTVFFSWKSDGTQTKQFIQQCIDRACMEINDQLSGTSFQLDEGVRNKSGAVEIPATILKKIDKCSVFISDVSPIGTNQDVQLHNQNVLFELGYALARLGEKKLILVFNHDDGRIRDLPFDFSHRNTVGFSMQKDPNGDKLCASIKQHIMGSLATLQKQRNDELDSEELAIMHLFKSMGNSKHVMVIKTFNGGYMRVISEKYDECMLQKINETQVYQKIQANLDDLTDKKFLRRYLGMNGTPNYELAKRGYDFLKKLG